MSKKDRLAQQIKDTEARWQRVGVRLGQIKLARELETRVEEQLRMDAIIAEAEASRSKITEELDTLETQLAALQSAPAAARRELEVFWSYAHADEPLRDDLARHLEAVGANVGVRHFHDRQLGPGAESHLLLRQRLDAAALILVLVSADYLFDDQLDRMQLGPAMQRHDAGTALVVPILLRPCDWTLTRLAKLAVLPKDGLPVVSWPDREKVLHAVALRIKEAIDNLQAALERKHQSGAGS